ncbi:MAG: glycine cleavage T C-terminal barrel domain-containing protein [Kiloniellaceae bacterium]
MSSPILVLSPRIRSTPYSAQVEALGVKAYTVYNHMVLPSMFRSLEADYWHLREHVQLWDVACERQVELRGPDAARLMQLMTPRDLARVKVGQCAYCPLVDEAGGMVNDPVVLKLAEDHFWLSIASSDVLLWAKGLAVGLGLEVAIGEPDVSPLAVQGPKAEALMVRVFGEAARQIGFFRFARLDFQGRPLIVARSGWSKQGGFEIYLDKAELGGALWQALWEAGEDLEVGPGCPNLIERIEGGLLSYGSDMTLANNPFECGLERYCRLDGADFLGRQALRRLAETGPLRQLRGLSIAGTPVPGCRERWRVEAGGDFAGQVSSAAWSPRLKTNIAIAMIEKDHWAPGTRLEVVLPDGARRAATVCTLPFADPL